MTKTEKEYGALNTIEYTGRAAISRSAKDTVEEELERLNAERRKRVLVDSLNDRYHVSGKNYRDRESGHVLITATDTKIQTLENGKEHAIAIVDIAESKQWESLKVKGNPVFKSHIWNEAMRRGVHVTGYKPTQYEKQKLAEYRERTAGGHAQKAGLGVNRKIPQIPRERSVTLAGVGRAPYKDNPNNRMNDFTAVVDQGVEKKIWGSGLAKAVKDQGVVNGEKIRVSVKNRSPLEAVSANGELKKNSQVNWNVKRNQQFVHAHAAAIVVVRSAKLDPGSKKLLRNAMERELVNRQNSGRIPNVSIYSSPKKLPVSVKAAPIATPNKKQTPPTRRKNPGVKL